MGFSPNFAAQDDARLPDRSGPQRRPDANHSGVVDGVEWGNLADFRLPDRMRLHHADGGYCGAGNGPRGTDLRAAMSFETLERPRSASGSWTGVVRHLHLASRAFLPMRAMPEITLTSPTEATGIWAMMDYVEREGPNPRRIIGYGHYHETYRKEVGDWKISSKRLVRLRVDEIPVE